MENIRTDPRAVVDGAVGSDPALFHGRCPLQGTRRAAIRTVGLCAQFSPADLCARGTLKQCRIELVQGRAHQQLIKDYTP